VLLMSTQRSAMLVPSARTVLGHIALPAPLHELAAQQWDVIVVGAGHNGLTCAAYLARAGKRVLVLEARERIGGACTLEALWDGVTMSPCAYLVGLLHPLVVDELQMRAHGFAWTPATNGLFVPFDDGSSIQLWEDDEACAAEIRRFAPRDVRGWCAMQDVMARLRAALRPLDERDLWIGDPPSREELEARIGHDNDLRGLLLEWSMVEFVERYLSDERLQLAYLGQGVIGTNASPFDPGTASIHFHHSCGGLDGHAGVWGYVHGGMGQVSFILCDIARELGAVVAAGVPVQAILPGQGVQLADGSMLHAPVIVSNADPRVTMRLLGDEVDSGWRAQVESVPMTGCTVKCNLLLHELPNFRARPGLREPHHAGQINTPLSKQAWRDGFAAAQCGELPEQLWTELYFQTVHDPSVAPEGLHTMSVFAQYVPYAFASGTWDTRRDEVHQLVVRSIGRYVSNFPEAIVDLEVLGPPDIEAHVGLTGGHIFQGECLPPYMWDRRLGARTPMPGVYLCGACTHPGGSVIAINGRNAAMAVLRDLVNA
jgi:phytoene dehydrogenase-like protein